MFHSDDLLVVRKVRFQPDQCAALVAGINESLELVELRFGHSLHEGRADALLKRLEDRADRGRLHGTGPGDTASLPYFTVPDMEAALEQISALGGSVIHPGTRWSICRDSEGSPFGLALASGP